MPLRKCMHTLKHAFPASAHKGRPDDSLAESRKSADIARSAAERPAIVLALPTATQSRLGTLATLSALAPVSHEFSR